MEQLKTAPVEIKSKQVGFHRFDPTDHSPPNAFMSKLLIRSNGTVERITQNRQCVSRVKR